MKIFGLLVVLFLSVACASETVGQADKREEFALAAIQDNILTTDYTALVKITNVRADEISADAATSNEDDLVAVRYTANVMESYAGGDLKKVVYTEYVKKSEGLEDLSAGVLIVSLCKDKNGSYYLPDIGYELPAESTLVEKAREVKSLIINKKISLRKHTDGYACN